MNLVIYVVDDQVEVADSTARVLRNAGHRVTVETDSGRALSVLLSDAEIDVIFLDLVMPDMLGSSIYEECESRAPARCERIIFLTGYSEMAPSWVRRTGRLVLEKPASPEKIVRAAVEVGRLATPRGPHYPAPRGGLVRRNSSPELASLMQDELSETTGVTRLAESGDVVALKIKHLDGRIATLEGHFQPKGIIDQISSEVKIVSTDVKIGKSWIKSIPIVISSLAVLLAGLWWFIHQADRERDTQMIRKVIETSEQAPAR